MPCAGGDFAESSVTNDTFVNDVDVFNGDYMPV